MKTKREIDTSCAITRTSVPALESVLGHAFPVLDHGFVRVIDYMGDDSSVIQMARTSYGRGTDHVSTNSDLLRYLMRNRHTSPFEGNEIKLHVKLPIFVARQWIRHRMANLNEYSARYSVMEDDFYIPEPEQLMKQSKSNKQGRGGVLNAEQSLAVLEILKADARKAYQHYSDMIYDDPEDPENSVGLARELARINLPINIYTQWYWKTDLHNLLHFLKLRNHGHAQYEIRVYAETIQKILAVWVPHIANAADDYIFNAIQLSALEKNVIGSVLNNLLTTKEFAEEIPEGVLLRMTRREKQEFFAKISEMMKPQK